jgi:DnaJ-class molecular chaperone
MTESRKVCNTCGGSGQIGYFQGESRFFITHEECPACFGLGYDLADQESGGADPETDPGADTKNLGEGE